MKNFLNKNKTVITTIFLLLTFLNILNFVIKNKGLFTEEFKPDIHQKLYGQSQYILKEPISVIPDEVVYALAGWEYVHGSDPILINGEQPPLGKYLIGLSEIWFNNSRFTAPVFNILMLLIFFFLSDLVLESKTLASILTFVFSFEKVFIAQMRYAPNLDNIQVFFILLSFFLFIKYFKSGKFSFIFLTFLSLGAVIATKFWVTGLMVFIAFAVSLIVSKSCNKFKKFLAAAPVIGIPLLLSYSRSFLNGMTFRSFLGTQKYIYAWHSAKLQLAPLAVWDYLLFNRWHYMGLIRPSVDWQITWPILGILSLTAIIIIAANYKISTSPKYPAYIIGVWFITYFCLLSVSQVNARYVFPVLPAMYILSGWVIKILGQSVTGISRFGTLRVD